MCIRDSSNIALDSFGNILPTAAADLLDNLSNVTTFSFGINSVCPGLNGLMSNIAIINSSSYNLYEGILPSIIKENIVSSSDNLPNPF